MALGLSAAYIFALISIFYNIIIAIKLLYETLSKEKQERNIWNIVSATSIAIGSVFMIMWYFTIRSSSIGWLAFFGLFLLATNNIVATIFVFKEKLKDSSVLKKISSIMFSLLALTSFLFILNKIAASTSLVLPRGLNWILTFPSLSYAIFEGFLILDYYGYIFPLFIIIPIAIPIKMKDITERKQVQTKQKKSAARTTKSTKTKKTGTKTKQKNPFVEEINKPEPEQRSSFINFMDNGAKGIILVLFVLLLIFSIRSIGVLTSFNSITSSKYNPTISIRADFEFGVGIGTGSSYAYLSESYVNTLDTEIELLTELGATALSIDVYQDLIRNSNETFGQMLQDIKDEGFKIILYAQGDFSWNEQASVGNYVGFENITKGLDEIAIELVSLYEPDYIVIYPEPFAIQRAYTDPNEEITVETWVEKINNTANTIHSLSNETKVCISLSLFDYDTGLFDAIWNSTMIDTVFISTFVFEGNDLKIEEYLTPPTSNNKTFWVHWNGLSPVAFGERIQAATLTKLLEICLNNPHVIGFSYGFLIDRAFTFNLNGLVAENGYKRLAYQKYKEIIAEVQNI